MYLIEVKHWLLSRGTLEASIKVCKFNVLVPVQSLMPAAASDAISITVV